MHYFLIYSNVYWSTTKTTISVPPCTIMQKFVSKFRDLKLAFVLLIIFKLTGLYFILICYKMTKVRGQQIMQVKIRSVNLLVIHSFSEQNLIFIIALILYHFNDELKFFIIIIIIFWVHILMNKVHQIFRSFLF